MSFRGLVPKLKDNQDTVEVRKALMDIEKAINEIKTENAALEVRIAALEGVVFYGN